MHIKKEDVIRNVNNNIICKISYNEDEDPVISIVGRHCETDIILRPGREPKVIYK